MITLVISVPTVQEYSETWVTVEHKPSTKNILPSGPNVIPSRKDLMIEVYSPDKRRHRKDLVSPAVNKTAQVVRAAPKWSRRPRGRKMPNARQLWEWPCASEQARPRVIVAKRPILDCTIRPLEKGESGKAHQSEFSPCMFLELEIQIATRGRRFIVRTFDRIGF